MSSMLVAPVSGCVGGRNSVSRVNPADVLVGALNTSPNGSATLLVRKAGAVISAEWASHDVPIMAKSNAKEFKLMEVTVLSI